jgi:predicted nucleic acid-binding protein
MPERYLIDSNIYDKLADDPEALALVEDLARRGVIVLLSTHIQEDEVARTPSSKRLAKLISVPVKKVPTYGIVLDVSRLDEARFSEEEPFNALRGSNPDHAEDALIAATAEYEDATLVTEDRRLVGRARSQQIRVIRWEEFFDTLRALTDSP